MDRPWQIELFGWLRVVPGSPEGGGDRVIARFRSRKAEALLAYLAYFRHRSHPRQQLAELLWPEGDPAAASQRLSVELTSLRRQLEPPGLPAGGVLIATRPTVQLNPAACMTDVALFEAALQAAKRAESPAERIRHLTAAAELYRGELLPGLFEAWVLPERQRLAEAHCQALCTLAGLLQERGDVTGALQQARQAVAADPLNEEGHQRLIRLLLAAGQVEAARLQYDQGQNLLLRELGSGLSPEIGALIRDTAPAEDRQPAAPAGKRRRRRVNSEDHPREPPMASATACPPGEEGAKPGVAVPLLPPLRPAAAADLPTGNLPLRITRFFGREGELAQLEAMLCPLSSRRPHSSSLVTLTGPGGTGKTRLATQLADRLRARFPGGVWFVSLRDLRDPALLPDQMLLALRLARSPHTEPLEQVAAFLSAAPSLLVLDNFEHLVQDGTRMVQALLEQVRHLTVLTTSRQRLDLEGEREFPVAPLPVPGVRGFRCSGVQVLGNTGEHLEHEPAPETEHLNTRTPEPLNTLLQCPSVALFVDRAQAVRPDFQVTARNAAAVAGLCRRLEGLPLAIELAAARAAVLTPRQMLARLEQRFDLLVGRERAADPRHRSLRAALDWSYELLSPELQRFFTQLSIFRGGWSLEAAAAICDFGLGPTKPEADTPERRTPLPVIQNPNSKIQNERALEYLEELQRSSLVVTEAAGEAMRYRLLETLREYAAEQLTAEERTALAQRHLAYYQDWFRSPKHLPGVGGMTVQQRMDEVEQELDNVRAAIDWWVKSGAARDWMMTGGSPRWPLIALATVFWLVRGRAPEGRQRLAEILALPGTAVPTRNRAHLLLRAGELALQQADFGAADALLQESLAIYQSLVDWSYERFTCCRALVLLARAQGDYARARSFHERHLAVAREMEVEWPVGSALNEMGYTAYLEGDLQTGQSLLEESLRLLRRGQATAWERAHPGVAAGDPDEYSTGVHHLEAMAWARAYLGDVADTLGDYAGARTYLEESLTHFREFGRFSGSADVMRRLGRVAQHQHQWTLAAAHFGASLAFWQQDGNHQGIAACLEGLGAVAAGQGEAERAARLLGAAAALRERLGIPVAPVERADLERLLAGLRDEPGENRFAAVWAAGGAVPLDHAIAEALQAAGTQAWTRLLRSVAP